MANPNTPERLNVPLQDKYGFFYPLTTYDQIIMPDGISRWNGTFNMPDIINADTLNGLSADKYALTEHDHNYTTIEDVQKAINDALNNISIATGVAF